MSDDLKKESEYVKKWASYFAKCRVNLASSGKLKESRSEWRVDFLKEKRRKASRAEWWEETQNLKENPDVATTPD